MQLPAQQDASGTVDVTITPVASFQLPGPALMQVDNTGAWPVTVEIAYQVGDSDAPVLEDSPDTILGLTGIPAGESRQVYIKPIRGPIIRTRATAAGGTSSIRVRAWAQLIYPVFKS